MAAWASTNTKADRRQEFAQDVRRTLALQPKQLQSKYLYDALGSQLFEAICRLPWYHITRAEHGLIERHARAIVSALRDPATIVELGGGNGEKLAILAAALQHLGRGAKVHLIDISSTALELSERTLGRFPHVALVGHRSTYELGLRGAAAQRKADETMMVLFLGSNLGNFDPAPAHELLCQIRKALRGGDLLLLGADLVKLEADLLLAYDDPLQVTAAFNKNLLVRLNRELQAEFDLDRFDHRAIWNAAESRVEVHLVSHCEQEVRIPSADCLVHFTEGESIWTESSYKYEPATVVAMGAAAGFRGRDQWIEPDTRFALTLFEAG